MKLDIKRLLTLDKCTALVTIIGFPLLLASLISAVVLDGKVSRQIEELTTIAKSQKEVADGQLKIAKSQNNIGLTQMFFHDQTNRGIIDAIYDNKPILKKSGGEHTSGDLDNYLGDLDMVDEVCDEGLLSESELCASFLTSSNKQRATRR
jgi:hypothetical protein